MTMSLTFSLQTQQAAVLICGFHATSKTTNPWRPVESLPILCPWGFLASTPGFNLYSAVPVPAQSSAALAARDGFEPSRYRSQSPGPYRLATGLYMPDAPRAWTIKAVWIHPPLCNIPPLLTVLLEFRVSGR